MHIIILNIVVRPSQEVCQEKEEKYWCEIDPSYMSEESTVEDDQETTIRKRTPI